MTAMSHEERRARLDDVVRRIKAGEDPAAVAHDVGLGSAYVLDIARAMGWRRPRQPQPNLTVLRVLAAMLRGEDDADIARARGVSRQYIHQIRKAGKTAKILT